MICPKCNKEYSDKVYKLHFKRCAIEEIEETEETEEEVRAKAKELGVKSWHVKSIDKLKVEIAEVD